MMARVSAYCSSTTWPTVIDKSFAGVGLATGRDGGELLCEVFRLASLSCLGGPHATAKPL
jgi:hypothetical protein